MSESRRGDPDDPTDSARPPASRRLTISPIGFDLVLALSQAPPGMRLVELANTIGSPVSSAQTALRVLLAHELVIRRQEEPPRYVLSERHPAARELAALSTVLPEAERALGILFRANTALVYAGVDAAGFIIAVDLDQPAAAAALDRHLALVEAARSPTPNVLRMTADEFGRMLRVSLGVRARVRDAIVLRGSAGAAGRASSSPDRVTPARITGRAIV